MLLSRLQRNDVFAAVTDVGFSPSDFDVRVLEDKDTLLTHRDSNSYFVWGLPGVDYLDEATGRMGRVDWRNLAYGVLLSDIVNAVLPPEAVRSVLMMLLQSVAHLFGHSLPTLPTGR